MQKKRARIGDIMQLTGLSRATVDRVLNGRSGVREATRARVEAALKELGYAPNLLSERYLAETGYVEVFIPVGVNPFFKLMHAGFERAVGALKLNTIKVQFRDYDPYSRQDIVDKLRQIDPEISAVILVGLDTPEAREAIDALEDRGVRVLTIISDTPGARRTAFIGQDSFATGRTAGRLMLDGLSGRSGTIAVMLSQLSYRHMLDRQAGFQQICAQERPDLPVIVTEPYGSEPAVAQTILEKTAERYPDLIGIYLGGGGQPHGIGEFARRFAPAPLIIGHEVSDFSRAALKDGLYRFVLAQDMYELGRKAIRAVLDDNCPSVIPCGINIHVAENLP